MKKPKPASPATPSPPTEESFAELVASFMAMNHTIDPAALREAVAQIKHRRRMKALTVQIVATPKAEIDRREKEWRAKAKK